MNFPQISTRLNIARWVMLFSVIITLSAIFLVYGRGDSLSLGQLIVGHLTITLTPVLFKFAYLLRLISLNHLGLTE